MHQQEEPVQVSDPAGEGDQNPEGERNQPFPLSVSRVCDVTCLTCVSCLFPTGAETREHCGVTGFSGMSGHFLRHTSHPRAAGS